MANKLSEAMLKEALKNALKIIDKNMQTYEFDFPSPAATNGKYHHLKNEGWTISFWTGMMWLAYELTGDEKYKECIMKHMDSFKERYVHGVLDDHDIGFIYTLSSTAGYIVTNSEEMRDLSVKASYVLGDRFREKGQFIQIWGDETTEKEYYRLIIDCLMNIQLLFFASEITGDEELKRKAKAHFYTTMECVIREDGSSFQNFYFDPKTGDRLGGGTKQGFDAKSCWSRGQAWGVTGIPYTYSHLHNDDIIPKYYKIADYFIEHLPKDKVAFWDHCFTDGADEPRDSSAASIAVCGLLEACRNMPIDEEHKKKYMAAAEEIMVSLIENYSTKDDESSEGLIGHGTYYYAGGLGIDEPCIWGDYFYMEAIMRFLNPDWKMYW